MPKKFEKGETVYFVQSAIYVKEAQVINDSGGFVTVKLPETGGGFRARENRFFKTKEEAERKVRR
ncbi:MAG: hypothetical protein IJG49_03745 [Erysipelotrichaceae bacterium]|nr:hypothetical protein [Erysipelotrichaceae bacterium]MBQ3375505.1 hypothetical protein [Erysipelotrichaceae bacterium]